MRWQRTLPGLVTVFLSTGIVACGGSDEAPSSTPSTPAATAPQPAATTTAAAAPPAPSAPTHAEYLAAVDDVCRDANKSSSGDLKKINDDLQAGRVSEVVKPMRAYATDYRKTTTTLRDVEGPKDDTDRAETLFVIYDRLAAAFDDVADAAAAGNVPDVQQAVGKTASLGKERTAAAAALGLKVCGTG